MGYHLFCQSPFFRYLTCIYFSCDEYFYIYIFDYLTINFLRIYSESNTARSESGNFSKLIFYIFYIKSNIYVHSNIIVLKVT